MLAIAQHNKITVGEGVTITGSKLSGGTVAKAFSILGGYQDGASTAANTLDTDITVLSGSKIYIVANAVSVPTVAFHSATFAVPMTSVLATKMP